VRDELVSDLARDHSAVHADTIRPAPCHAKATLHGWAQPLLS
jgi:hypothetical protein